MALQGNFNWNILHVHLAPSTALFFFLGPYLWHMEVSRLGAKLELQLPQQRCIQTTFTTYTAAVAISDPETTERGQGIKPASLGGLCQFLNS